MARGLAKTSESASGGYATQERFSQGCVFRLHTGRESGDHFSTAVDNELFKVPLDIRSVSYQMAVQGASFVAIYILLF